MHHPILQALFVYRPSGIQTELKQFAFLLACTPIIVGLCYLFHLAFERPFMKATQPISSEKSTA
jgi:peptidoglycan/LPS O-acetylase OafA/YrhL